MSDDDSALMKEFEEFLKAKQDKDKQARDAEDFDVEIWDETGKGVRTKRSHAKPFLQSLGLDLPEKSDDKGGDSKDDNGGDNSGKRPVKKQSNNTTSQGVATKYFTRDKKN